MIYFLIFLFIFFESIIGIGYFFPGSLILALSVPYVDNFFLLFFVALTANLLGSTLNYFLGYFAGKKVLKSGYGFLGKDYFKKGINFAHRYKGRFILIGKLVPGIKEIITFIAGVFHIPFRKFMLWNLLGALLWFLVYFLLGYIFGFSYYFLIHYFGKIGQIFGFVFIFLLILIALRSFLVFFGKKMFLFVKQIFVFLKNRYFPNIRLNFSLAMVAILFFIFFSLFFSYLGFAKLFYTFPLIHNIDISISNTMSYFYDYRIAKFALIISYFGSFIGIILLSILFLSAEKNKVRRLRLILGILSVTIIVLLTKYIIARHRPELSSYSEYFYSFPSFHAALSTFFYLFVGVYLAKKSKYWNDKVNWFIFALFMIILIGLSRLYLNVHYFSDIIGGYWIGFVIFVLVMLIPGAKSNFKISFIYVVGISVLFILGLINYLHKDIKTKSFLLPVIKIDNFDNFLRQDKYKYVTTIFGRKTEPINFIFLASTGTKIKKLFIKAGFVSTDKISLNSIKKLGQSAYAGLTYPTAPMLPLIWNNLVQTYNFQAQENSLLFRHHIRIWDTNISYGNYRIFVGSAVFDAGLKWKITHRISPDLDSEREYFFKKLIKTGLIGKWKKVQLVLPTTGYNFSYDKFFTDGKAYILWIK